MRSRRDALRSLATIASVAGAGCAGLVPPLGPNDDPPESVGTEWTPPDETWALSSGGPRNTRRSGLPVGNEPPVVWRVPDDAPGYERELGAATSEAVYTVARTHRWGGTIQARTAADGGVRWQAQFKKDVRIDGVVEGTVYAVDNGREVHALAAGDGRERWRVDPYTRLVETVPAEYLPSEPDRLDPRLVPTPDTVYAATSYGLHGLVPTDGRERWRAYVPHENPWAGPNGVAVTDQSMWVGYGFPDLDLAELSGQTVRTADTQELRLLRFNSLLVLVGDLVCVTRGGICSTGEQSPVAAGYRREFNDDEPTPRWTFPGVDGDDGPTYVSRPATDGARLVFLQFTPAGDSFRVTTLALDAEDGAIEWLHETPVDGAPATDVCNVFPVGAPAVADDTVLVGIVTAGSNDPANGRVVAIDAAEGHERWRVPVGIAPREIAIAGDRIYVAGRRGGLVALERAR